MKRNKSWTMTIAGACVALSMTGCAGEGGGEVLSGVLTLGLAAYLIDEGADPNDVLSALTDSPNNNTNNNVTNTNTSSDLNFELDITNFCPFTVFYDVTTDRNSTSHTIDSLGFETISGQCERFSTVSITSGVSGSVNRTCDTNIAVDFFCQ